MRKKVRVIACFALVFLFAGVFSSCHMMSKLKDDNDYEIVDARIYKGTPAWNLALAVMHEETNKIEMIVKKDPDLLNYQDPKNGATLLTWSVGMEKYKSAETLLKCGADPNIAMTNYGETPLTIAAGFSWVDNDFKKDPKYIKLLLRYGADPNKCYTKSNQIMQEVGTSPLMCSLGCGIEKTKALVEGGADINHKTKNGETAASDALFIWDMFPEYAYYLIVEKKAKVTDPFYLGEPLSKDDPAIIYYPVAGLRNWIFDLGSIEYKIKMKIVEEFARQGVNYWKTEINEDSMDIIMKRYPETWKEYIKKY